MKSFEQQFACLTGFSPFPWQTAFYNQLVATGVGESLPSIASIPTGLGKTNVVAIWLIALARSPETIPRRLVYVVNRRTVVDQTTSEVNKLRENVPEIDDCWFKEIAVSTLRGQFADNEKWAADPSRPAVICGTVDLIGSRLMFEGYRIGFRKRPLHAGFLGQDAWLIHDEAHLEPAFQNLLESIVKEQRTERRNSGELPWLPLSVTALSATARDSEHPPFTLTKEEKDRTALADGASTALKTVRQRMSAAKFLRLHPCENENQQLAGKLVDLALDHRESGEKTLIFTRKVDDVAKVKWGLEKAGIDSSQISLLTGTMRGLERDQLIGDPVFSRFLHSTENDQAAFLICTSAGEVGVNLSSDHLVCDLSTFESMAQRFGRVNRFGEKSDSIIDVVYPGSFTEKGLDPAREKTLALLNRLDSDASPQSLARLGPEECVPAFSPIPEIPVATPILFDGWALTTLRGKIPGRPPIAPFLHGIAEWEAPRTSVSWRDEVEVVDDLLFSRMGESGIAELVDDFPIKPHELLSDRSDRVFSSLQSLGKSNGSENGSCSVWLVSEGGEVRRFTLGELAPSDAIKKDQKEPLISRLENAMVLLPPKAGGLTLQGYFDGTAKPSENITYDVSHLWTDEEGRALRVRIFSDEIRPDIDEEGMALFRTLDTKPHADEQSDPGADGSARSSDRYWHWFARPHQSSDVSVTSVRPITLEHHTKDVASRAESIVKNLRLPEELAEAVLLAAEWHDLGKRRDFWQRSIGNPEPTKWYAKPGKPQFGPSWIPHRTTRYRHEFGSLMDVSSPDQEWAAELNALSPEMQDVVLHLIASHHGFSRPHFPEAATVDPNHQASHCSREAEEAIRRFERMQKRYGRWGLAFLESILRAADWSASAAPSQPTQNAS
ncbi:MAG: type I-U CRISPR-associated helicase/endonuclease Cas3 [Verrucomicrobiota bacterium]